MPIEIRAETPGDVAAIHALNASAFETDVEARLVDALRAAGALTLSLVAVAEGRIVGHIAFSPVTVTSDRQASSGVGLAPMAVLPELQRTGIGGRLIREGLQRLRDAGHRFCIVLGHPDYYPRHGFRRASTFGIRWENAAPDEAFMAQELAPGGLTGVGGIARYHAEFDGL
jgi:putative acetyltransferase